MPDCDTFFREYVFNRKPVIITDLFKGEPIRSISSLDDARHEFGNCNLLIQPEYTSAHHAESGVKTMRFNEYWEFVSMHPSTRLMCIEHEIPARVMALFKLPDVCLGREREKEEILGLSRKYGEHDLLMNLFMGNEGNKAHLHYDGDQRQVLLYQVFGTKEIILFQPESGAYLKLLDSSAGFAGMSIDLMSEDQKRSFIDAADGYHCVLRPGEAIYIPMLMWHYLRYTEHSMSFNLRFGRNRYGRFLCVDNFHRDYYIQNVASRLADEALCETKYNHSIRRVIIEYLKPSSDLLQKIKDMRSLFLELCSEICPDADAHGYCLPECEEKELAKIVEDSKATLRYAHPTVVAQTRPVGPISPNQARQLEEKANRCGYPPQVLRQLLLNRIGKVDLDRFTKADAAQFLSYMASPGAAW